MHFSSFAPLLAVLCGIVAAHPTERSQGLVARDCSAEVAAFNLGRREKRGHAKRTIYSGLLNLTCILSPEAPLVDYVANAAVQQDVTDGQPGVAFTLDIGILDITTCQPLPNAMVEVWSPNAQGIYGSFLRGAYPSTYNGIAEIQTVFPGYTSGSANHINLRVHGTSSTSSAAAHVGQVFFTDQWTNIIAMSSPYNTNQNSRMLNANDPNFAIANSKGYSAIMDIEEINDDWPEGIVGYITVGINPSA